MLLKLTSQFYANFYRTQGSKVRKKIASKKSELKNVV